MERRGLAYRVAWLLFDLRDNADWHGDSEEQLDFLCRGLPGHCFASAWLSTSETTELDPKEFRASPR
jgi:hypothetical protein